MSQTLRETAYQALKHKIVTLEYEMGRQLVEQELCDDLGIGRTPVREALQQLSREKLIVIIPRKGMFVSDINAWELQRLVEARTMLEVYCARAAAQLISKQQVKDLKKLFAKAPALAADRKIIELLDIDRQFHEGIVAVLDNPFIAEMARRVYDLLARTWHLSFHRRSVKEILNTVQEHLEIIEALDSGDPRRAEEAVLNHVEQYGNKVLQKPYRAQRMKIAIDD
ncbi:MAG: GntR family transcriptional regulator [Desulfarculaceae bacterium]|jgi:DNA-binding GntR family transcriptional regulator